MNQTWENKKNPLILDTNLACLAQIWAHKFLPILVVRHRSNLSTNAI